MRVDATAIPATLQAQGNEQDGVDVKRLANWAAFSVVPGAATTVGMMSGSWGDAMPLGKAARSGAKVAGVIALAATEMNLLRDAPLPQDSMAALATGAGYGFAAGATAVVGTAGIVKGSAAFRGGAGRELAAGAILVGTATALVSAFAGRVSPDRAALPF